VRPLEGLRVLDPHPGPLGSALYMLLGDLGAEVIKVQGPGEGDVTSAFALPFQGDQAAYFLSIHRSKKTSRSI
jgi:crotonobetainyl-CoA:carnitine CoA-transferase CaiB-like acyl-CoA transferase